MKKIILFLLVIFLPFIVSAKSDYLYNVLKNEAESNGLAKEYTGEHHDSFIEEPSKKIYHWYAANDQEGELVLEKNNIIFGGFCWQIVRTTDTGGVKIIYNGEPVDGKCDNHGDEQQLPNTIFNIDPTSNISTAHVGYMFNSDTIVTWGTNSISIPTGTVFGSGVTYSNNKYSLTDIKSSYDENHHYSCMNTTGTCISVRYFYYYSWATKYSVVLRDGMTIEDVLRKTLYSEDVNSSNSTIKNKIDSWYSNNLSDYTNMLEDTVFCNDRKIIDLGGFNPNGGGSDGKLLLNGSSNDTVIKCDNETDRFSLYNSNALLTYPVGLMTKSEMSVLGNNNVRNTGSDYWISSPHFLDNGAGSSVVKNGGDFGLVGVPYAFAGVRPSISIKPKAKIVEGNGTKNNPYKIGFSDYYSVDIKITGETDNISVNFSDLTKVEKGKKVEFKISPIKGFKVKNVVLLDEDGKEIAYVTDDNINYEFIMPASDVTIVPSYERVKNNIGIVENEMTMEFKIEVGSITAVVYEDVVRFILKPKEGYEIDNIVIVDENNNSISYKNLGNNEYEFKMPDTNVTIKPSYKKVVIIDDGKRKEIVNPKTVDRLLVLVFISILSVMVGIKLNKKRVLKY